MNTKDVNGWVEEREEESEKQAADMNERKINKIE